MKYKVILFFCLISFAVSAQNVAIDSIPFKLEKDNRIYTYCKVNNSDSLYFLIDSGASDMIINSERLAKIDMTFDSYMENIGATGTNSVKASSSNTFHWSDQEINEIMFTAIPYPNERWDGVLGLSVLRRYTVKIDYNTMQIYLYDKKKYQNDDTHRLKINYKHQVPIIEVEVQTYDQKFHKLQLELDLGSDRVIDISTRYVNEQKLITQYKGQVFATSTISSSDGNSGKVYNVYLPQVNIAEFVLYKIPGGLGQVEFGIMNTDGIDGIIGNWFLKRFNLTFDFENDYLFIEPNNNIYTPFYDFLYPK